MKLLKGRPGISEKLLAERPTPIIKYWSFVTPGKNLNKNRPSLPNTASGGYPSAHQMDWSRPNGKYEPNIVTQNISNIFRCSLAFLSRKRLVLRHQQRQNRCNGLTQDFFQMVQSVFFGGGA